ncbi:T9SS type A sorting domain-containing protein [Maribacter confluentis]|uniref:Por secretion system C-terminal sorting domain-containing protein n=2 Tax=Maribacter TaxID=252356 RepID=A0ABY1SDS2_9FLAO|nr:MULTISPECIES: T9SS type A sorting domain-containing protein [Maribacter]MDO1513449.1 T9SS type A sorting domain-containing protein [Maribacter confluentis]SNR28610.1 Por secretion system C-terminal sorting domain-containing protein [Maribacter sedimenticola]
MKHYIIFIYLTVLFCLNTQAQNSRDDVKIFPNPATNVVNVIGLVNTPTAHISITDVYGNQVISHQWRVKNNALNIPIFNLENGIYLIIIRSDQQTIQRKFYKQ